MRMSEATSDATVERRRASFLGNSPSFLREPDRAGNHTLYTNLPYQGSNSAAVNTDHLKIDESPNSNKKDLAYIKNAQSGNWSIFATTGRILKGAATSRNGHKLSASGAWRYIGTRDAVTREIKVDTEILGDILRDNGDENIRPDHLNLYLAELGSSAEGYVTRMLDRMDREAAFPPPGNEIINALTSTRSNGRPLCGMTDNFFTLPAGTFKFNPHGRLEDLNRDGDKLRRLDTYPLAFYVEPDGSVKLPIAPIRGAIAGTSSADNLKAVGVLGAAVGMPKENIVRELTRAGDVAARQSEGDPFLYVSQFSNRMEEAIATYIYEQVDAQRNYLAQRGQAGSRDMDVLNKVADHLNKSLQNVRSDVYGKVADDETVRIDIQKDLNVVKDFAALTDAFAPKKMVEIIHRVEKDVGGTSLEDMVLSDEGFGKTAVSRGDGWAAVTLRHNTSRKCVAVLVPPSDDNNKRRDALIAEVTEKAKAGWELVPPDKDIGQGASNFNLRNWLLFRNDPQFMSHMGGKFPRELYIKGGFAGTGKGVLDANGEVLFMSAGQGLQRENYNVILRYAEHPTSFEDAEKSSLLSFLPPRGDDVNLKAEKERRLAPYKIRSATSDPVYIKMNADAHAVASALGHAAEIGNFGGLLAETFPKGFRVRKGGVSVVYKFDHAGVLYAVDAADPDNINRWKPVPATILAGDTEYVRTLKALATLAQNRGMPRTFVGDDMEIVALGAAPDQEFKFAGDVGKFQQWHDRLQTKLAAALDGEAGLEFREAVSALMAFPTMQIDKASVYDEQSRASVDSFLVSCAIRGDDAKAESLLSSIAGPCTLSRSQAMQHEKDAIRNYNIFTKWLRASYDVAAFGDAAGDVMVGDIRVPAAEARSLLKEELLKKIEATRRIRGSIVGVTYERLPREIATKENRRRFSDARLVGRAGNLLFEQVLDPLKKWINDSWDYMMAVIDKTWFAIKNPRKIFKRAGPGYVAALYEATKLFFQIAARETIDAIWADEAEPIELRSGKKERVQYAKVRAAATKMLEDSINLKPISDRDRKVLGRITKSYYADQVLSNNYGRRVKLYYAPEFTSSKFIEEVTAGDPSQVSFYVPPTRKGRPSDTINLTIPLMNLDAAEIPAGMASEIDAAGPDGLSLPAGYKDAYSTLSPEAEEWWRLKRDLLSPTSLRSRDLSNAPETEDNIQPKEARLVKAGRHYHLRLGYSAQHIFRDRGSNKFRRNVLGVSALTSPKDVVFGER